MTGGVTLGKYQIRRELARSNDIVYEALDPSSGRRIALKELQLPPNLTVEARQERIQRFTREARAAASLKHENIVRILDHGHVQGRYYIAMEFLQGQSLRDHLRSRGPLPLNEAIRICCAVADGLAFAHRHGVVHRDVKPDNVHLEPDQRVVITDFGIARLTFEPTLTAAGQVFGTPSYMSPEQVLGKNIDARSDIFSLGVMLYEMISGRKPFTGDTVVTITYNIVHTPPAPPGCPPGLGQVISKALAKDPASRYARVEDMKSDLQLVARGQPPRHAGQVVVAAPPVAAGPSYAPAPQPPSPIRPLPPMPAGPSLPPRSAGPPVSRPMSQPVALPPPPSAPPPAGFPGAARPLPPPVQVPHLPAHALPSRSDAPSGWDMKWLAGWLGVAVVTAALILMVVWAGLTASDRFAVNTRTNQVVKVRQAADRAYTARRFQEAFDGYSRVAQQSSGVEASVARRNAAAAGAELATEHLTANRAEEAERIARESLQFHPDSAAAYIALGRALGRLGRLDEARTAFEGAGAAVQRLTAAGASADEVRGARQAADTALSWYADSLYRDGERLMIRQPAIAAQRFQEILRVAPASAYAKNAQVMLQQLDRAGVTGGVPGSTGGEPLPSMSDPNAGEGAAQPGVPPAPGGWNFDYSGAVGTPGAPR